MKFEIYPGSQEQPNAADVSGAILDRFIEENRSAISMGNFGIVSQNLLGEISRELAIAEKSRGLKFSKELARYLEDDFDSYRSELDVPEGDEDFKASARDFLRAYQGHEEELAEVL